jgi:hypothetical protein
MKSLARIVRQRREIFKIDPFAGINFVIFSIDATALLSMGGGGDFILDSIKENTLPSSNDLRQMPSFLSTDLVSSWEWDLMAPTFDFLRDIIAHSAKLGQISRQIRHEAKKQPQPFTRVIIAPWQHQTARVRDLLKHKWNSQVPPPLAAALGQNRLLGKTREVYENVS